MSLDSYRLIMGKQIKGVVVRERNGVPATQVFLLFDDNTYFEMFSGGDCPIKPAKGLDKGDIDNVVQYMNSDNSKITFTCYTDHL